MVSNPIEELATVEYIPCLMDIKSQRAVKTKLEKIGEECQVKSNLLLYVYKNKFIALCLDKKSYYSLF